MHVPETEFFRNASEESEVMRGPGSIPTRHNIFHWIFFCFHGVKPLMQFWHYC